MLCYNTDMNKSKSRSRKMRIVILAGSIMLVAGLLWTVLIPLDRVQVGQCSAGVTRLSLLFGGKEQIESAKQDAQRLKDNKEPSQHSKPGGPIGLGCGIGHTYELYLFF